MYATCLGKSQQREELTIFDILTRPSLELSPEERDEVKKVARELLERLKELLVLNWRLKSSARSQIKLTIEDVLDSGLPRIYDKELYENKCSSVIKHVYESYPERDRGVYAEAGLYHGSGASTGGRTVVMRRYICSQPGPQSLIN